MNGGVKRRRRCVATDFQSPRFKEVLMRPMQRRARRWLTLMAAGTLCAWGGCLPDNYFADLSATLLTDGLSTIVTTLVSGRLDGGGG